MTADKLEEGPAAVVTDSCYRFIIDGLRENNLDIDILDDDTIGNAALEGDALKVNEESFSVLILPDVHTIQRATMSKLAEFWRQGGTLIALRSLPSASPEYGASDPQIAALVEEIWGSEPAANPPRRRAFLFSGGLTSELEGVISLLSPSIVISEKGFYSQQRRLPDMDLFYLVSMHPEARSIQMKLNQTGIPELWDPQSGTITPLHSFWYEGNATVIPLEFEPYGAQFISLKPGKSAASIRATNLKSASLEYRDGQPIVRGLATEPGMPWAEVQLDNTKIRLSGTEQKGTESLPVRDIWRFEVLPFPTDPFWHADMDQLELMIPPEGVPQTMRTGSWTHQGLPGFSGIGRYSQEIEIPVLGPDTTLTLDLGEVRIAAKVYWDGKEVGERGWAPYRFTLPDARPGKHKLVVEVANTLANYISVRHADSRLQWAHFTNEQLSSGLLGPVKLSASKSITLK